MTTWKKTRIVIQRSDSVGGAGLQDGEEGRKLCQWGTFSDELTQVGVQLWKERRDQAR